MPELFLSSRQNVELLSGRREYLNRSHTRMIHGFYLDIWTFQFLRRKYRILNLANGKLFECGIT